MTHPSSSMVILDSPVRNQNSASTVIKNVSFKLRRALLKFGQEKEIDFNFISREAGDDEIPFNLVKRHFKIRRERGEYFYSDMLFVLTRRTFEPHEARNLWSAILVHKRRLTQSLGRNVGISVASLDYLSNIGGQLKKPLLVPQDVAAGTAVLAVKDGLTGLFDQKSFYTQLSGELERSRRYKGEVSVILFDLDHFKSVNDTYGHQAGDDVLKEVSKIVQSETRSVDIACRYGGEEFAIVAGHTSLKSAFELAERIRIKIQKQLADKNVTASFGVSSSTGQDSPQKLASRADSGLYSAKKMGRNQTCVFDNDLTTKP